MKRCFCVLITRVMSYEKLFLYAPYIKIDLKNRKF